MANQLASAEARQAAEEAKELAIGIIDDVARQAVKLFISRNTIDLDELGMESADEAANDIVCVLTGVDPGCLDPDNPEELALIEKPVNDLAQALADSYAAVVRERDEARAELKTFRNTLWFMKWKKAKDRAEAAERLNIELVEVLERAVKFETDDERTFIELRARGWHFAAGEGRVDDGKELWSVTRGSTCLNKLGEWEYEPLPSSRTEEFYERCRWNSRAEAEAAIKSATPKQGEVGRRGE